MGMEVQGAFGKTWIQETVRWEVLPVLVRYTHT